MVEQLVISGLAQEVVELQERLRAVMAVMSVSMEMLHEQQRRLVALDIRFQSLQEELRRYTRHQVDS